MSRYIDFKNTYNRIREEEGVSDLTEDQINNIQAAIDRRKKTIPLSEYISITLVASILISILPVLWDISWQASGAVAEESIRKLIAFESIPASLGASLVIFAFVSFVYSVMPLFPSELNIGGLTIPLDIPRIETKQGGFFIFFLALNYLALGALISTLVVFWDLGPGLAEPILEIFLFVLLLPAAFFLVSAIVISSIFFLGVRLNINDDPSDPEAAIAETAKLIEELTRVTYIHLLSIETKKSIIKGIRKASVLIRDLPTVGYQVREEDERYRTHFYRAADAFHDLTAYVYIPERGEPNDLKQELITYFNLLTEGNFSGLPVSNTEATLYSDSSSVFSFLLSAGLICYLALPPIIYEYLLHTFNFSISKESKYVAVVIYAVYAVIGLTGYLHKVGSNTRELIVDLLNRSFPRK